MVCGISGITKKMRKSNFGLQAVFCQYAAIVRLRRQLEFIQAMYVLYSICVLHFWKVISQKGDKKFHRLNQQRLSQKNKKKISFSKGYPLCESTLQKRNTQIGYNICITVLSTGINNKYTSTTSAPYHHTILGARRHGDSGRYSGANVLSLCMSIIVKILIMSVS